MFEVRDGSRRDESRKEGEREKRKAELGVCRIRKVGRDGKGSRTVGAGSIIKNMLIDWPKLNDHCCLVTTDKVLPDEDLDLNDFLLDFAKLDSTFREFKLATYSDGVLRFTSGLVVIPLRDPTGPTGFGNKPSIFTFRPFTRDDTAPSGELFCPIADDTDASQLTYEVKTFALKDMRHQGPHKYVLLDGDSSFNTLAGLTGTSYPKIHGSVVLSDEDLHAVGVLYFSDDQPSRISPIWLSKENLSKYFYIQTCKLSQIENQ